MGKSWYDQKTKKLNAHIMGMKACRLLPVVKEKVEYIKMAQSVADSIADRHSPDYPAFKENSRLLTRLYTQLLIEIEKTSKNWYMSARDLK